MDSLQANDTLFANVTVIDGTGSNPRYLATVVVRSNRIHAISKKTASPEDIAKAKGVPNVKVVDGENGRLALAPGFIDMHAHSDLSLLHTPTHAAKITQGVTFEVIGQDGISYAPVNDECLGHIRRQIAGWNGNPEDAAFWRRWRSVREYLDVLDASRIATNAAYLVPQGNLRMLVLGYDARAATEGEIAEMKRILVQALEDGAVGMSSGLTYVPGMYAPTSELGQLLEVVAQYGGYYSPHTRSYGKGAIAAYREMIDLARATGVRLHLTHATLNFEENKDKADEFIAMLDAAIADGIAVTLDTYPYLPGSTMLAAMLPSWAGAGGIDETLARLQDPETLKRIRHEVEVTGTDGCNGCTLSWEHNEVAGVNNPALRESCVGKTLAEIAAAQGREPFDVFVDIMLQDKLATMILMHVGHEHNVRRIMRHPAHTASTDGILVASKPHPRGWGTFPRYLGHYARDLKRGRVRDIYDRDSLSAYVDVDPEDIFAGGLEEAIAHMTSRPAKIIGLRDRGVVAEGKAADLVVFDPETILDVATFSDPERTSAGIHCVLVNGEFALDEGKLTERRAGRTFRFHKEEGDKWMVS